ncbi:MAG: hypothetical protein V5A46_00540 [Haloferacaceae archaeon]
MSGGILASAVPELTAETATTVTNVLKAAIGISIAVIAYRGYRRNRSRPMLVIAIGFLLVLGLPFLLFLLDVFTPAGVTFAIVLASEASQLLGLLAILYALRMEP